MGGGRGDPATVRDVDAGSEMAPWVIRPYGLVALVVTPPARPSAPLLRTRC